MKRILLLFVLLTSLTLGAKAQSMLVATLTHDTEVTNFLGPDGLKNAYNAAVDGDVITLSSGSFNAVDISKAITVRGAGMLADQEGNGTYPTFITGDLTLSQNDDSERAANFEGIYFTGTITHKIISNARFLKCHFSKFSCSFQTSSKSMGLVFIQCIFNGFSFSGVAELYNCILSGREIYSHSNADNISYQNCVIYCYSLSDSSFDFKSSTFNNCIFISPKSGSYLADSGKTKGPVAFNCVCVGATDFFKNVQNNTNRNIDTSIDFFANGLPLHDFQDVNDYILTATAAETYLGADGTQVGMYGGSFPFDPIPTGLRITKFNVAPKSTVDGKLSIDISVSIPE